MPSHRTVIRDYLKTLLTGKTIAGDKVYTNRAKPLGEEDMPCLLVYTGSDQRGRESREHDMSMVYRKLEIVVECAIANAREFDLESAMEQAAEDIQGTLAADETLGKHVIECRWQSTDIDIVSEGRKVFGAVRVEFEADLYTRHDADMDWWEWGSDITEPPSQPPTIIEPAAPDLPPSIYINDPETAKRPAPPISSDPRLTDEDGNPYPVGGNGGGSSGSGGVHPSTFLHGAGGTVK